MASVPTGANGANQDAVTTAHGIASASTRSQGEPVTLRAVEHSDEARHEVAVPVPQQLGDHAADREADRDDRAGAEGEQHGGDVVGAVLQLERARHRQAPAVAAQVEREHPVPRRQRGATSDQLISASIATPWRRTSTGARRRAGPFADDDASAAGKGDL